MVRLMWSRVVDVKCSDFDMQEMVNKSEYRDRTEKCKELITSYLNITTTTAKAPVSVQKKPLSSSSSSKVVGNQASNENTIVSQVQKLLENPKLVTNFIVSTDDVYSQLLSLCELQTPTSDNLFQLFLSNSSLRQVFHPQQLTTLYAFYLKNAPDDGRGNRTKTICKYVYKNY